MARRRRVVMAKRRYRLDGGPFNGQHALLEDGATCTLPLAPCRGYGAGQYVRQPTAPDAVLHWRPEARDFYMNLQSTLWPREPQS